MTPVHMPAEDQHENWLRYGHTVLAMGAAAKKAALPLWKVFRVPEPAGRYGARAAEEIERCMSGAPSQRRRALAREATRFAQCQGWRADIPALAESLAHALRALATHQVAGKAGSPQRALSATRIPERAYVNRAVDELVALALSQGRPDWAVELLSPGAANAPSRGRALVAHHAVRLAQRDGVQLDAARITAQIRERAKGPIRGVNWLADLAGKRRRKPKRAPLIRLPRL